MSTEFASKSEMQLDAALPAIENPRLPSMDAIDSIAGVVVDTQSAKKPSSRAAKPARGKKAAKPMLMETATKVKPDRSGKGEMGKFKTPRAAKEQRGSKTPPPSDQQPTASRPKRPAESYVRIHVHVENGQMSVVDARQVDGPLSQPDAITGGYAAEVSLDQRRISLESVPDIGVQRAYVDPENPQGREMIHGVSAVSQVDFIVRVASNALSLRALPEAEIALYQVKDATAKVARGDALLGADFGRELRELSRLKGIRIQDLPTEAQRTLRRAFK